jgi:hypothetical protein
MESRVNASQMPRYREFRQGMIRKKAAPIFPRIKRRNAFALMSREDG